MNLFSIIIMKLIKSILLYCIPGNNIYLGYVRDILFEHILNTI